MVKKNRLFLFLVIVFPLIIIDQVSKNIAKDYFQIVCNRGIAFGLGNGTVVLTILVLLLMVWLFVREKKAISYIGFLLIFAGGISNLIDRVSLGCVRDFISLFPFPSFNLADSVITIGAIAVFSGKILLKNEY